MSACFSRAEDPESPMKKLMEFKDQAGEFENEVDRMAVE
jgi:hypothetical protein